MRRPRPLSLLRHGSSLLCGVLIACGSADGSEPDPPDTSEPSEPETAEAWEEAYRAAAIPPDVLATNERAAEAHPDGDGLCCDRQLFRAWDEGDCLAGAEAEPFSVHPLTSDEFDAGFCDLDICLAASLDCYYRGVRVGLGSCLYYDAHCSCLELWSRCHEQDDASACTDADACVAARAAAD